MRFLIRAFREWREDRALDRDLLKLASIDRSIREAVEMRDSVELFEVNFYNDRIAALIAERRALTAFA